MPDPEILDVPPREAVEHFRAKGYHVGFHWLDTSAAEHARSFTVAKATSLDILDDIREEVDRAIAEGTTLRSLVKALEPKLVEKGWWGQKEMVDPLTGETITAQLGSRYRLKTIFDTNVRMAYSKGRWERIERVARRRPWLRYVAVQDDRTRPAHMAWHGTILPWDHPFWQTHYPPNGWRCRCMVEQLSEFDLEQYGLSPSDGPPPDSERSRAWTNKRTGETIQVPVGIDPGFGHNVGQVDLAADAQRRLAERTASLPPDLAEAARRLPDSPPD